MKNSYRLCLAMGLVCLATGVASAQSFRVQCPDTTTLHLATGPGSYTGAPYTGPSLRPVTINQDGGTMLTLTYVDNGGAIKCQQISGGDGYATMADGTQTYLFAFGPLSGLSDIANGLPGTELNTTFNSLTDPNGAVGLAPDPACAATPPPGNCLPNGTSGHVDPRPIMDVGVMNGNMPAPLMAFDEDDEFFLTLTNVGQIMRPDLFEQHTVHFHGYPNASAFYDGVPDASVAINIGGSFTYYYLAPDAGTYFWHCHITPPEHLQMGMVGQLYVRPRQNRVPPTLNGNSFTLFQALQAQQNDPRTKCGNDILCSTPLPVSDNHTSGGFVNGVATKLYAYNDGDGSTQYDVEYPIQIHGFDPSFHFVGMTFNPEQFTDMKDKYFLLNGRSYPDTINVGGYIDPATTAGVPTNSPAIYTQDADGVSRPAQPLPTLIQIPAGGRALLRIASLDVTEYQTLASLGIPMQVIAINARLLRDEAGNNLYYNTNSITLGGGESLDVILDACAVRASDGSCTTPIPSGTYYLFTPQLDHLSNDAENFGGLMTEVVIK